MTCYTTFDNYEDARVLYQNVCSTFHQLPQDTICSLERNETALKAHRFTRDHQNFRVDTSSTPFIEMVQKRAGSSGFARASSDSAFPPQVQAESRASLQSSRSVSTNLNTTIPAFTPNPATLRALQVSPQKKSITKKIKDSLHAFADNFRDKSMSELLHSSVQEQQQQLRQQQRQH